MKAHVFTLWCAKMEQKDIAKRIRELQRERSHRLEELGHRRGSFRDNRLGWSSSVCGSSFNRQKT